MPDIPLMSDSDELPDPKMILNRMEVPGEDRIFVLGCFERPATLHMQQCRALNLLWALQSEGRLFEGMRVAVVGGGVGGLTAAAAALLLGFKVTVLEKHGDLLPIQRGNHTRHLHPNIYNWPDEHSDDEQTQLPLMNWKAALAGDVARELLDQWKGIFEGMPDVSVRRNCELKGYQRDGDELLLMCNVDSGYDIIHSDLVVFAVGFGIEKNHEPLPFNSYWHDDNLHQPVLRKNLPRRYLVSGCGDGGLIDALRLQIDGFKHGEIHELSEILQNGDDVDAIKSAVRRIEDEALLRAAKGQDVSVFLFDAYKTLNLSDRLKEKKPQNRFDTIVHLHDKTSLTPLTLGSALLNRLMIFILVHYRGMKFHRGEVDWENVRWEKGLGYRVEFKAENRIHVEYYDEMITRHGPDSAMGEYFPGMKQKFDAKGLSKPDPTRLRMWPDDFQALLSERAIEREEVTKTNQAVNTAEQITTEQLMEFVGPDVIPGLAALQLLLRNPEANIPAVMKLLDQADVNWTLTHYKQVTHRFKLFFASCQHEGIKWLVDDIQRGRWPTGGFTAECFDYFSDRSTRIEAANELMTNLTKYRGDILNRPDGVRFGIKALGYLGIADWRFKILDVLQESKVDSDQKFRNYALTAAAMLLVKGTPDDLPYLHTFLNALFYGFGSGEFSPDPAPLSDREIYWSVRRHLGRRKESHGADFFHLALKNGSQQSDKQGFVRGCYAHILGSLRLGHTVQTLTDVAKSDSHPQDLRLECLRSLARMRLPAAANALRDLVPVLEEGKIRSIANIGLVCVAHYTENPQQTLKLILDQWHSEFADPFVLRAIGFCNAVDYRQRVDDSLNSPKGEVRGQAVLARARMGAPVGDIETRIASSTEHVECVLASLASLVAGGRPDTSKLQESIQQELFDWSGLVVEDLETVLGNSSAEYKQILDPWQSLIEKEAENLKYLY